MAQREDAGDVGEISCLAMGIEPFIGHKLEPFVGDCRPVGFGVADMQLARVDFARFVIDDSDGFVADVNTVGNARYYNLLNIVS